MGDADLRELERRWRETGSVEDETAYLRELVRSGLVPPSGIRLAAYLGHEAASVACGGNGGASPALDEWIRGLEAWSADLAIWAYAEAALADGLDEPAAREHFQGVCWRARQRLSAGGLPAPSEHDDYPLGLAHGKVLLLALKARARDRRYPPDGDPEVVSARRRIVERFPSLDAGRWRYNHVERVERGWAHVFRYVRQVDRETTQLMPASAGWEPAPRESEGCLPGRKGVFGNLLIEFGDGDVARERVRTALLPWALRGVPASVAR